MNVRVAVAYHTGYGKTGSLARAVAAGASGVEGASVDLLDVHELDAAGWAALDAADAIIFGSPTYFGSISSDMKRFLEATVDRWVDGPRWKDKLAAGFTNSKTMSGDKLNTLFDLAAFAAQHGMIWVGLDLYPGWHTADAGQSNVRTLPAGAPQMPAADGDGSTDLNRLGSWLGAMSQANSDESADATPPSSDLATGEHLGRRVAEMAMVFSRGRRAAATPA
ncbi:MAG: flavodoxin family protein [Chloroflexota bacterium]|nr:flavodoxin family protein [Chloroflexota bacterium]